MPRYLGNFPNAWVSGKFPKCLGFWENPQIPIFVKSIIAVVSCQLTINGSKGKGKNKLTKILNMYQMMDMKVCWFTI